MYGDFGITADALTIFEAVGMLCDESSTTIYETTFSSDCQEVALSGRIDACTGARTVLGSHARLRRR